MPQEAINPDEEEITADEYFVSPAKGKIIALEEVPDKTFSQKLLGDGFAIDITDGKIVAPISGKLETVFPSEHAFGIKGPNGEDFAKSIITFIISDSWLKFGIISCCTYCRSTRKCKCKRNKRSPDFLK